MSSCPNEFSDKEKEVRDKRISEIKETSRKFLRGVVKNLCLYEGVTGRGDMAFRIKRLPIIIEVMRELADELEEEDGK